MYNILTRKNIIKNFNIISSSKIIDIIIISIINNINI